MSTDDKKTPAHRQAEAFFRYLVISQVLTLEQQGVPRPEAIKNTAKQKHRHLDQTLRTISARSLYRWLKAFETDGFDALSPATRQPQTLSRVISPELLDFFKQQKEEDPLASVPELIRRAQEMALIESSDEVGRSTLWRCLKRMGVHTGRSRFGGGFRDKRRFAWPHRLDMVLCDGKHFRAGSNRLRRVALFFLDDATRFGLTVVVGTSETTTLFLKGVYQCFLQYGAMNALYVDHGSGFTASESIAVLKQLKTLFIHGEVGYPQGRGKLERFNQTAWTRCLRHLDGNIDVDPDPAALELRVRHFLFKQYNQSPHESLELRCPQACFDTDTKPLRFMQSTTALRGVFAIPYRRRVSKDNVVSFKGQFFEMPIGYEGQTVTLRHLVLKQTLTFIHQGKEIELHPCDLFANASYKRARPNQQKQLECVGNVPQGSAQIAFKRDFRPIIDDKGGFSNPRPVNDNRFDNSPSDQPFFKEED